MKKVSIIAGLLALSSALFAQTDQAADSLKNVQLDEIVVSATRAGKNTPMAYRNISQADIRKENAARNIPFVLQQTPSLVAFTEDGSGVGNTSMRIRGTDATRINVTLNGMPLNNPESQEVYWVNLPDLSSSLQSIQVQRGVGTSSNGAAAFGASISLKTVGARSQAYGEASTAVGSYNTFSSTIAAGSGIMKNGLSVDARYSRVLGDGYIRNGFVNHSNLYAAISHYAERQLLRLSYIKGVQHTGITWEGVTQKEIDEFGRRYNPAGKYKDDAGNTHYYNNETDNYYSDILQLIFSKELNDYLTLNTNLSWNHGFGYYENYKTDRKFENFGLKPQVINGKTYEKTDMVRQKLMRNNFYVANVGLDYTKNALKINFGAMYSFYDGDHFGQLPWIKHWQSDNQVNLKTFEWYRNKGKKQDASLFAKAEYRIGEKWSVFGDIQGRFIDYKLNGMEDGFLDLTSSYQYKFFNPKAGVFFRANEHSSLYSSIAVGNREPLRADIKDAIRFKRPIYPERMYDFEMGYKFDKNNLRLGVNLYYMLYDNQLVQTGRLNDSGYKIMENVKDSYRAGVELEASIPLLKNALQLDATATLSRNKIKKYNTHYSVDWDPEAYQSEELSNTDISFSPSITGSGVLTYRMFKNLNFRLSGIYVGKQYLDNTSDNNNSLKPYFVNNISASYDFKPLNWGSITLDVFVNNLFNKEYISNAYGVKTIDSDKKITISQGFYPQATRNYMARVTVRF